MGIKLEFLLSQRTVRTKNGANVALFLVCVIRCINVYFTFLSLIKKIVILCYL